MQTRLSVESPLLHLLLDPLFANEQRVFVITFSGGIHFLQYPADLSYHKKMKIELNLSCEGCGQRLLYIH